MITWKYRENLNEKVKDIKKKKKKEEEKVQRTQPYTHLFIELFSPYSLQYFKVGLIHLP